MKLMITILLVLILITATACGANVTAPKQDNSKDGALIMEEQSAGMMTARANFAFSLYPQILHEQENKNMLISPASIMLALMMVYNGADGETRAAMESTLSAAGLSLEEINQANQAWMKELESSDELVELKVANSLWGREGIEFEPAFVNNLKEYYQAKLQSLDFSKPTASKTINEWVSDQTNKKINQIVGNPIGADIILFLINAIYFNGKWEKPFDPSLTKESKFHLVDAKSKQHPFMNKNGTFLYSENDKFQAIALPYGNGEASMYVFLPNKNSSIDELHAALTSNNWTAWMKGFQERKGALSLPKFKLEYEVELIKALTAMGMGIAFAEGKADFSKIVVDKTSDPFISSVKHKTYMDVHEEGTEAAAVTSIGVSVTSLNPNEPKPFEMKVDRPFFIVIKDNRTDSILFMGSVYNPEL